MKMLRYLIAIILCLVIILEFAINGFNSNKDLLLYLAVLSLWYETYINREK